jgi:sulfur carrier protein
MARIVSRNRNNNKLRRRTHSAAGTSENAGMHDVIQLLLNGESRQLAPGATIATLLDAEGLATRRVAVEVNGEIVPRSSHAERALAEGDRVEIVHALGGG